ISRTRRVTSRTINLDKIAKLNNLSREVAFNKVSIEDAEKKLSSIADEKEYPLKIKILGYLISASTFNLLFGGNLKDSLVSISRTRRVTSRTINLDKIAKLNNLSREVAFNKVSIEDAEKKLSSIADEKEYPLKIKILGYLISASTFTLLFGGNLKDSLVSGFIGIVLCLLAYFFNILKTNNFFVNIISGALASLLAFLAVRFNIAPNLNEIIIGSLMPLVPGLAITNSLRDIIAG